MTRRDYETVAQAMREARERAVQHPRHLAQHLIDCEAIGEALARDNPAFDYHLFIRNCGVRS